MLWLCGVRPCPRHTLDCVVDCLRLACLSHAAASRAELNLSALSLWWRAWVVPPPPACLCAPIAAALCVSRVPFCDHVAPCHNHFAVVFLWASPCVVSVATLQQASNSHFATVCCACAVCVLCRSHRVPVVLLRLHKCVVCTRQFCGRHTAVCPPLRVLLLVCGGAHLHGPGAVCGVVKMVVLPLLSAAERLHVHQLASALHAS